MLYASAVFFYRIVFKYFTIRLPPDIHTIPNTISDRSFEIHLLVSF